MENLFVKILNRREDLIKILSCDELFMMREKEDLKEIVEIEIEIKGCGIYFEEIEK